MHRHEKPDYSNYCIVEIFKFSEKPMIYKSIIPTTQYAITHCELLNNFI